MGMEKFEIKYSIVLLVVGLCRWRF